jgi:hypothetical protein
MKSLRQFNTAFQDDLPNFVSPESKTSSLPNRRTWARVPLPQSRWMIDLQERFDELASLPIGWDGYLGRPVSFTCAYFAANLIERLYLEGVPAPQLVPGGDGTVQLEWHRKQFDVEIDILAPCEIAATRRDLRTGLVEELELQTDFTALASWISELQDTKVSSQKVRV